MFFAARNLLYSWLLFAGACCDSLRATVDLIASIWGSRPLDATKTHRGSQQPGVFSRCPSISTLKFSAPATSVSFT